MTHLFSVQGTVCTGTDVLEDLFVAVGALGAFGAVSSRYAF